MNKSEIKENILMNINVNYILTFLFLIIELIGILGNMLVIISLSIDGRMKRSLTNRLIIHVGCCDLIILLFNIPDLIQFMSSINGNWILNEFCCKLIRSILVLAQYASVLTMCCVTIERFIGIVYPLRSKFLREKKHVTQITLLVWIFSFLCASPNLIYLRVQISPSSRRSCSLQYSDQSLEDNQRGYMIHKSIESTIFYFIPLLIQLYSYIRIAQQLVHVDQTLQTSFILTNKTNIQPTQDDIDDEDDYIDNDENLESKITITESSVNSSNDNNTPRRSNYFYSKTLPGNKNALIPNVKSREERRSSYPSRINSNVLKSRRSVIKMLVVVVLIYFISFSPQVLIFILFDTNLIQPIPQFIQTSYFIAFTMLLVTISSASNPIVYAIFCYKFRQSFARILRRLCFCGRPTFNCHTNQRSTSVLQIQKRTYHFTGKIINNDQRQTINKNIIIQINDKNTQRR